MNMVEVRKYWREEKKKPSNRRYMMEKRKELKMKVLSHYSQGTVTCCSCGISDVRVLSIDHIEGGGSKHRKKIGQGNTFYKWLVRNNFPSGYQVLCMNCQFIKRYTRKECEKNMIDSIPLTSFFQSVIKIERR